MSRQPFDYRRFSVALDRVFDPLLESLTPAFAQKLVEFRADEELQARLDELADKCTEGQLSSEERREYEAYMKAIDLVALLQAKARQFLRQSKGA